MNIINPSKDLTCKGQCTKCGECCGSIIPLTIEDIRNLKNYVLKNNIKMQKQVLVMKSQFMCPYYTGNKEKGCVVYEARPKICRFYQCNKKQASLEEVKELSGAIPTNMWELAERIENEKVKR